MNDNNILRSRQQIISKLTEARLEKQMSQAELASLIGTQRSKICRKESGWRGAAGHVPEYADAGADAGGFLPRPDAGAVL